MAANSLNPAGTAVPWRNNSSRRILVADDDADIRHFSSKVLADSGYQVDTAEDGAAAWSALTHNYYDLLITDNNMPNLSGIELLENLLLAHLDPRVILVSGAMPTKELERHPWLQIDAALVKPYTIAEFLGTVQAVLGTDAATQERKHIGCRQNDKVCQPPSRWGINE
jgi:DNA-binding response OmpR family regulator